MSFILDALRKSERERQQEEGLSISRIPDAVPTRGTPTWAITTIVALGIGFVAVGGAWVHTILNAPSPAIGGTTMNINAGSTAGSAGRGAPASETRVERIGLPPPASASPSSGHAATVSSQGAAAPLMGPGPSTARAARPSTGESYGAASSGATSVDSASSRTASIDSASSGAASIDSASSRAASVGSALSGAASVNAASSNTPASTALSSAARARPPAEGSLREAAAASARSSSQATRSSRSSLPAVDPAPENYTSNAPSLGLPELRIELLAYADEPAQRFVFINGQRYREGDALREGPQVIAINARGAVLLAGGRQLQLDQH